MDLITHVYVADKILKENKSLSDLVDDQYFFLFSNVAADFDMWYRFLPLMNSSSFHNLKISDFNDAIFGTSLHGERSFLDVKDFFGYSPSLRKWFSENSRYLNFYGVDYFSHSKNGFIKLHKDEIKRTLKRYGVNTLPWIYHTYIEYAIGNKIANEQPEYYYLIKDFVNNFYPNIKRYYESISSQRRMSHFQYSVSPIIFLFFRNYPLIKDYPAELINRIEAFFSGGLRYINRKQHLKNIEKAFLDVQKNIDYQPFLQFLTDYYKNIDFNRYVSLLERLGYAKGPNYLKNVLEDWQTEMREHYPEPSNVINLLKFYYEKA